MKTLIIYCSEHHGNTKTIAEKIARILRAKLMHIDKIQDHKLLDGYEMIGFGSGIYYGRYHKKIYGLISSLPKPYTKKAFIFATSGMKEGKRFNRYNHALSEQLKERGLDVVGEFSCRGHDSWGLLKIVGGLNRGRPNKEDMAQAASFAYSLKKKFQIMGLSMYFS